MDLNKQSWYVRWFFWSLGVLEEFVEYHTYEYRNGTNLCHFVRVVFAYAPLALVLNLAFYAAAVGVVTVWPVYLFGWGSYLTILGFVGGVGLVYLVGCWLWSLRSDQEVTKEEAASSAVDPEPSFSQVVWEAVVAKKRKVCPLIRFYDQQDVPKGVANA